MQEQLKIKVAQVITRMDWGGSPDIVRIICSNLDPAVYDITLILGQTRYPNAKTKMFLNKIGAKTIIIPQLKRDINFLSDTIAFLKLYSLFRRYRFDIVHTHTAKAGALGRLAAFLARVPVIVHTLHGHNFYGYFGKSFSKIIVFVERFLSRVTDKIIVLTGLEKEDLVKFKAGRAEKMRIIYQGLELENLFSDNLDKAKIRSGLGIAQGESVVGMVSRLEAVKGPQYFIEAALLLAKRIAGIKFILVGEGKLRRKLEERVREAGLADNFIFTGWRDDALDVASVFDVLVLPSLNEAVGIVLIEAQYIGIPVVATNVGGIPEIVRHNETGVLVEPADPAALAQAVECLLTDKEKRRKLAGAAHAWVRGRFMAEDMVAEISKLYQEMHASNKELSKDET